MQEYLLEMIKSLKKTIGWVMIVLFAFIFSTFVMSFVMSEHNKEKQSYAFNQLESLEKKMADVQWRLEILEELHTNELEAVKHYEKNILTSSVYASQPKGQINE